MKKEIKTRQIKRLIAKAVPAVLILIALIVAAVEYFGTKQTTNDLSSLMSVSFIDVGQGDCELIQCSGVNILIDGGEAATADFVVSELKSKGVEKLDLYIISHPHSDHMGAASKIIDSFTVDKFVTTDFSEMNTPTSTIYENMLDSLEKQPDCQYITVKAGDTFEVGELSFLVVSPSEETTDYNNMSIVVRVDYKNTRFLFTGDAEEEIEKEIIANGYDIKANVLKVGHHGSSTSTCAEFLKAVSPEYAVISCGADNSYGHPHKETTDLLKRCNVTYFRTDESGTITLYSDGNKIITEDNAA